MLGTVQGHLCKMLIDSGSSATLVSDWFAESDLDLSPTDFLSPSPEDQLCGASRKRLDVVGSFIAHNLFLLALRIATTESEWFGACPMSASLARTF